VGGGVKLRKISVPLVIALVVLGVGSVALAYWWWGSPYYGWRGPGAPMRETPYGGRMHPFPGASPWMGCPFYGTHMGKEWSFRGHGFPEAPYERNLQIISKVVGIPLEKLQGVFEKYLMPPRSMLRVIALSQLLNKDIEEVAKGFKENPFAYLSKNNVDPSVLTKKLWEIKSKLFEERKGR